VRREMEPIPYWEKMDQDGILRRTTVEPYDMWDPTPLDS